MRLALPLRRLYHWSSIKFLQSCLNSTWTPCHPTRWVAVFLPQKCFFQVLVILSRFGFKSSFLWIRAKLLFSIVFSEWDAFLIARLNLRSYSLWILVESNLPENARIHQSKYQILHWWFGCCKSIRKAGWSAHTISRFLLKEVLRCKVFVSPAFARSAQPDAYHDA